MARSTSKEALGLVKGTSETVQKLPSLIQKMDHELQRFLTEKELGNYFHQKFLNLLAKNLKPDMGTEKDSLRLELVLYKRW